LGDSQGLDLVRTWTRVHLNGLAAMVKQYRVAGAGHYVYRAGAVRLGESGPLRMTIATLDAALAYAEEQARSDAHVCAEGCGIWVITVP
jgi:hypothetical protein